MTITVRMSTYRFDPAKRTEHAELRAKKRTLWAEALTREPGYLGEICVEAGEDRQVVLLSGRPLRWLTQRWHATTRACDN